MVARRMAAALAATAATLAPAMALACPMCAGRPGGGPGQWVVLAGFVLLPFPLVGAVIKYIRSESDKSSSSFGSLEDGEKRE